MTPIKSKPNNNVFSFIIIIIFILTSLPLHLNILNSSPLLRRRRRRNPINQSINHGRPPERNETLRRRRHRRRERRRGPRRSGAVEGVRPELPAGADGAGSQPVADTAGEREPPVSAAGQHGEKRGSDTGAEREHLQGRLSLLRPQLQLLHLLPQPPLPQRRMNLKTCLDSS